MEKIVKKYYRFLVIFLVLGCWMSRVATAQVVNVPDPNLAAALRETLGLAPNAPITRQQMQRIIGFEAINRQIRDLTGLEHAPQLRALDLGGNQISDIRPLAGLTQLGALSLAENRIRDISVLTRMRQLEWLFLWDNQISDIRPLADLVQLERLNLADNQVINLIPLARLARLTELYLDHNQIISINPLTRLSELKWLALKGNRISDLNPLRRMTQLERLALESNQIRDVTPLAGLTKLTHLFLKDNQIRDVSALAKLVNLRQLILAGNPIADTSPLANLKKLDVVDVRIAAPTSPPPPTKPRTDPPRGTDLIPDGRLAAAVRRELGLASNAPITKQGIQRLKTLEALNRQITNLTGLEHATQLERLELNFNQIRDVSPLAGLTRLTVLNLSDNQIRDVRPLLGLTRLVALNLSDNQFQDVSLLAGLTQLKRLFLYSNQIQDVSPLADLTQLTDLGLGGNQIQDVSPLAGLTQLDTLFLSSNQIQDVSPLAELTRLKVLWLTRNNIRDVSALARLVNLETLKLAENPITDTSPLASLTKLVDVDIKITPPVVRVEAIQHSPMYWIDTITGTLHRLMNTEMENLVPSVRNATSLALDRAGGKLYWAEKTGNSTGRIRRANLNGTNVQLVKDLTSVPHSIAFDAVGGKIYLTNAWGKVQRLNVNGSNFEPNLITELDAPRALTLDVLGGKVYWIEASGRIRRANLDGSNLEDVATGLGTPISIAISGDAIYWTEKTGADRGEIRTTGFNGNPTVTTLHTFSAGFAVGIAVDAVENKLYWTTSRGSISRSNLDGGDLQADFVTGLIAPGTLVLDVEPKVIRATDAVVSISPSSVPSPTIGDQLMFNVNISTGEAVAGYQATVQFDPTALRYVESSNGDYLPPGAFFVPPVVSGNRLELASTALSGVSNGDGTLATLTFEVVAAKASTVTLTDVLLADSDGDTVSPQVENGQVTEPERLAEDVNNDGVVDVRDLVLVASNFGQSGGNTADVNSDGVVNIADLVLVAGALGTSAAAPSLSSNALEMLTTADVRGWLSEAQQLDVTEARTQHGIRYLEQLLTILTPKETVLLANYPNPFNPETWIPYQLAKPADVTLTIYGVNGLVIRRLSLGHQLAGTYQSRDRAAYWDGRNALGEPVASGLYFYTLTAGDFTATRKMLIKK